MGSFVVVRGLRKGFGHHLAIDDVSFEVQEGELVVLLGPSGCGKTTTLRCLGGLERPEAGEIVIDGREVTNAAKGMFLQPESRGMGMVAQSYAIWPHMSVYDNVAFPLRMRGERGEVILQRVKEALDVVRLSGFGDRNATELSGGQQQRIALARAIVGRPKVLLFDEPLSNLDAKLREQMRYLVKDIQQEIKITAVYVTHDQAEAMAMGDELIVMNSGKIEQRGDARTLYRKPKTRFVADFIGVANLLDGKVVESGADRKETLTIELGCDANTTVTVQRTGIEVGSKVVVLVRPEWFIVSSRQQESGVNSIRGVVHKAQYLGEHLELKIGSKFGELRVNASSDDAYRQGQDVYLTIDERKCVALPAN